MVKYKVTIEIEDDDDGGIRIKRTVFPIQKKHNKKTAAIMAGMYIVQHICEMAQDDFDIVNGVGGGE